MANKNRNWLPDTAKNKKIQTTALLYYNICWDEFINTSSILMQKRSFSVLRTLHITVKVNDDNKKKKACYN